MQKVKVWSMDEYVGDCPEMSEAMEKEMLDSLIERYDLSILEAKEKIKSANYKMWQYIKNLRAREEKKTLGDACSHCGNIEFLRTGTCTVCTSCGTSQGCS